MQNWHKQSSTLRWQFFSIIALCLCLFGCHALPNPPHLPKSLALSKKITTTPHHATNPFLDTTNNAYLLQPMLSGYYPVATGADAFVIRSLLSDMANTSIDAQYYIWHNDEAGQLMLKDLWEAAERGVTVRLLLDDLNSNKALDDLLVSFAKHPNIAVRLVNPAKYRTIKALNFIINPIRTNVRMHNKSMTFDRHISIIGGRNIGNEYLNQSTSSHFADLDILLVGAVVPSINDSFDDYWQSPVSFDIETLVQDSKGDVHFLDKLTHLTHHNAQDSNTNTAKAPNNSQTLTTYHHALDSSQLGKALANKMPAFRWGVIDFVADNANKLSKTHHQDELLVSQLRDKFGTPTQNFSIISSYFVPTYDGVQGLIDLALRGTKIQILTNSYDATDVGLVHAGYAHWRKKMLQAGIRLYEVKATASPDLDNEKDNRLWRIRGESTTSLHAKAFAVDNNKVFIGSYNIDPRSANINTEMGVVIYDHQLANRIHQAFNQKLLHQAYEVKLHNNQLQWHTIENGQYLILTQEPHMQLGDKLGIYTLSKLPIDWLL